MCNVFVNLGIKKTSLLRQLVQVQPAAIAEALVLTVFQNYVIFIYSIRVSFFVLVGMEAVHIHNNA